MTKKIRGILIAVLAAIMVASLTVFAACKSDDGSSSASNKYTVTFYVENEVYQTQQVTPNRRATKPDDPVFKDSSKLFTAWYTDETFTVEWDFSVNMVTSDMSLYAGYRQITEYPSSLSLADEPCTSKLVWTQASVSSNSDYTVTINDGNVSRNLTGSVSYDSSSNTVTFTPDSLPQGGYYNVTVTDISYPENPASAENVLFRGAGTEGNPYIISTAFDFTLVNMTDVKSGTYFKLFNDISLSTDRSSQRGYQFNGTLDGNGKTVTLENSNCAMIYSIGAQGVVKTLTVAGAVSTSLYDSVGTVADFNYGRVEKIATTASVTSTSGKVGESGIQNALNEGLADGEGNRGIAGGIIGTNYGTVYNCSIVTSSSSTGVVKASIGGGLIVGYNAENGVIELCVSEGCIGAWNSTESGGKSLSNYSYCGGIAGINAGEISECVLQGSGKLLAQRYGTNAWQSSYSGTNNSNFGGIAGYNMASGVISKCSYSGIRCHADENVGGIAGSNAGLITDCIAEGAYKSSTGISYVGGRVNVGGIVGYSIDGGTVENCISTVNVYCYTANTAYMIASGSVSNSVCLSANPNTRGSDSATGDSVVAVSLPSETDNTVITINPGQYDGTTTGVLIGSEYLDKVNGNNAFVYDSASETIKLDIVYPEENYITVALYSEGVLWKTITVTESGSIIAGPVKTGYVFSGWALTEGGDVVFSAGEIINYYDFNGQNSSLYAVFTEREQVEYDLVVAVWTRYIAESEGAEVEAQFKEYILANYPDANIYFKYYSQSSVADFGAAVNADGDVDVIIGSGANITSSGGVAAIVKDSLDYSVYDYAESGRQAALLTDRILACEFYAYVTGQTNASAEVTLVGAEGDTQVSVVNSITANSATLPLTDAEDKTFAGWALTEDGEIVIDSLTSLTYGVVESFVQDGKVTLYAVFTDGEQVEYDLIVAVWTRYIAESEGAEVEAQFKEYILANYPDANIYFKYYSQSSVADFGAAVNADGDVDVIIGSGANITSSGGVAAIVKDSLDYSVYDYAESGRQAALLTDRILACEFYAYVTGQTNASAEVTLVGAEGDTQVSVVNSITANSATLPLTDAEDKTFAGWALTEDGEIVIDSLTSLTYDAVESFVQDGKVTLYAVFTSETLVTLRVGYYYQSSNAITEEELSAIKSAFEESNSGYVVVWQEFRYSSSSYTRYDMVDTIVSANGDEDDSNDIDVLINFAANILTSEGTECGTTISAVNSQAVGTRYVVQLTDNAGAALFYEFAQTNQTLLGLGA